MISVRRGLSFAGALLLAAVIGRAADAPPGGEAKMPRESDRAAADEPKPGGPVTLTQKEYQDLLDRLARAEAPARPDPPSSCKITGRVAGDLAQLTVEFDFQTRPRRSRVALGCTQGFPTEAKLDGHPPTLKWGTADGYSAQVDDAGDHQLVLKIDVPLAPRERGGERGFDLDLPAAAVTTLDLDLPAGVKKALLRTVVRGEAKPAPVQELKTEAQASRLKAPGLGPVERVEVSWEGAAPAAGATLLNVSASQIDVGLDDRDVRTTARITLGVRRGAVKEVQLLVPWQAVIRGRDEDDRIEHIDAPPGELRTVRLKQPTTDPLTLTVEVRQSRTREPVPVGPFLVLGAFPQGGDIVVTPPAETILDYRPRGESLYLLTQRDPGGAKRDAGNVLALRYSTRSRVEKGESPPPFFALEAERLKGVFEAGVTHALRLVRDKDRPGAWRITTTIEAQASQAEADHLEVRLPPGYTFDEAFGVQSPNSDPTWGSLEPGKKVTLQLNRKRKGNAKVALTFEGQYSAEAVPVGDRGEAVVPLPGLPSKLDRGAVVSVTLPGDLELIAPSHPGPFWNLGKADAHNKRTWTDNSWPERVEVAWRPYRPPLVVNGEARVKLEGRRANVIHRLWLPPGQTPPPEQLALDVPKEIIGLKVAGEARDGVRLVPLVPPVDRDHPLVLLYSFALPERGVDPFPVPLVSAVTATGGETRVCFWSEAGTRPELKEGPAWTVRRTEEVKDETSYPSLVLQSDQPGAPLTLGLGEAAGLALAGFRVQRVLIQAKVGDGGQQTYRARFLLSQVAATTIDVDLPAPLFRAKPSDVTVLFAGKAAVWRPVDEAGKDAAVSRTARVQVPADLGDRPAVLEVNYSLLPGRTVLQTQLQPPQLRGDPGAAQLRWQVVLPPSWVPLSQDVLGSEYGWGRRGWLFALRPTVSATEFEHWFTGSDAPPPDAGDYPNPAVAVWRSAPEPLRLSHVPEQPWLLVCSLTLLIVGLALAFLSLPRTAFWGTLAVIGVGALLAGLFWPGVLGAVLYGCQPGALVLLPVLGVHWLLHQRYRRQVVFLPGFTRLKAGSSLNRGGSNRPRGEPSTVDAVPPAAAEAGSKKPQADGAASG